MLLFYLPFILFTFSMFAEAYHHPHKLPQNYDYKIVVEDKANVLGNTAELRNSLVAFYNRTGTESVTKSSMTSCRKISRENTLYSVFGYQHII